MAKKRDDIMCIRIPSDEKAVIKQIADTLDNSMTDMVLFFVRSGVAAHLAPPAPAKVAKATKATKATTTKAKK